MLRKSLIFSYIAFMLRDRDTACNIVALEDLGSNPHCAIPWEVLGLSLCLNQRHKVYYKAQLYSPYLGVQMAKESQVLTTQLEGMNHHPSYHDL